MEKFLEGRKACACGISTTELPMVGAKCSVSSRMRSLVLGMTSLFGFLKPWSKCELVGVELSGVSREDS